VVGRDEGRELADGILAVELLVPTRAGLGGRRVVGGCRRLRRSVVRALVVGVVLVAAESEREGEECERAPSHRRIKPQSERWRSLWTAAVAGALGRGRVTEGALVPGHQRADQR